MAGNQALVITEHWIRDKLNLGKESSLDGYHSLCLSGSYECKISHLARSLINFSNIKHLDLSRNFLESLEGLDTLKHLESINLYYNYIPNLKEVFRLHHNIQLKNVDLRLNPVTQLVPDYRMFMIHMLMRLNLLDDRIVTGEERKAAIMYFDTDQAYEIDESLREKENLTPKEEEQTISINNNQALEARIALTDAVAPTRAGLGADTEALLELFSKKGNDLFIKPVRQPRRKIIKAKPPTKKIPNSVKKSPLPLLSGTPGVNFTPHPQQKEDTKSPGRMVTKDTVTMDTLNETKKLLVEKDQKIDLLKRKLNNQKEGMEDLHGVLDHTHNDMAELKEHHQTLLEENKTLQSAGCIANENTTLIESLNNQLTSQKESIDKLSQQISTQNSYLHKLISSLEASQKMLEMNNKRLMKELSDVKAQHSLEVTQLSSNYDSLRALVHDKLRL